MDNYFIKAGYQARSAAPTFVDDIDAYWNAARQASANAYQWAVYRLAGQALAQRSAPSVLDVGCGYPAKLRPLIEPVAARIALVDQPSMAPLMARDFPAHDFQGTDLEAPQAQFAQPFDVVICADVIEHLCDPLPLLEFLKGQLAPGGQLFLSTPERDRVRGQDCRHSPNPEHVREWNQAEFGIGAVPAVLAPHPVALRGRQEELPPWRQLPFQKLE
ncbi:MAG: class I SAM-dependent methyltransferase [Pseudomonadota bacterium]